MINFRVFVGTTPYRISINSAIFVAAIDYENIFTTTDLRYFEDDGKRVGTKW